PNLFQAWIAGGYPLFQSVSYNRQYFLPNDTVSMSLTLKNKGLSSAYNISLSAASLSNGLTILDAGGIVMDSLQARSTATAALPIRFAIGADVLANVKLKMVISTTMEGILLSKDTVAVIVGLPTYLLIDSANNISQLWTVTASPVTPKWETTTSAFVSAPSCYTDSKTGTYANNATVTMLTTNTVNLTGYPSAKLTFTTKWDIEKKWDCMVVMASTDNGSTWTALTGSYTVPASGSGKQVPAGMPCYDGIVSSWVNEVIDLSPFANKQIKLKFELRTDGSQQKDGIFLDDIGIVVYTLQQQPTTTWSNGVVIKDAGNTTQTVTFGTAASATDGIDVNLGEVTLPPLPPSGVFDTRFELPVTPAEFSAKDFRNDTLSAVDWMVKFQPGLSGYPMTLTWNPASLPQGTFLLKDIITGTLINVDMKAQNEYIVSNTAIGTLKIEYRKQVCKNVGLSSGWNMVSVPLQASNMASTSIFAQATSQVYGFNNGYVTTATLENSKGYWVRYGSAASVNVCGNPVTAAVPVTAGWNMIGVYDRDVQVSGIASIPANIVNSVYYGFNNGYSQAATLNAGKGYWVRVSQNGTLNISGTGKGATQKPEEIVSAYPHIVFSDAVGSSSNLYFAGAGTAVEKYAMPPLPPQGVFDVRFMQGTCVSTEGITAVALNSVTYPLSLRAAGSRFIIKDLLTNGKTLHAVVEDGKTITIAEGAGSLLIETVAMPKEFALEQNYPNPFNPSTVISYQLPENGKVKLTVFDCLGTEIATIVDGAQAAGKYNVTFNGANLSSGVYYYTLSAGKHTVSRKMLLLK
ncbi:MAG: immune inhibitor A, partial [Ignavibacteriales bacterium]|nr:immune inhibitor A [Ignavibacteriales bacterium]